MAVALAMVVLAADGRSGARPIRSKYLVLWFHAFTCLSLCFQRPSESNSGLFTLLEEVRSSTL